jgi:hypothetical protein
MKKACMALLTVGLVSSPAFSQSPVLNQDWTRMSLPQEECLKLAENVMRKARLNRIERVGSSVFGDTPNYQHQLAVRCVAEAQVAFFAAAGRESKDAKGTEYWLERITKSFKDGLK